MMEDLFRTGDQLEFQFTGSPWNCRSPRYLTRFEINHTFAKAARLRRDFDAEVTDPHQLELRLQGGSFGS